MVLTHRPHHQHKKAGYQEGTADYERDHTDAPDGFTCPVHAPILSPPWVRGGSCPQQGLGRSWGGSSGVYRSRCEIWYKVPLCVIAFVDGVIAFWDSKQVEGLSDKKDGQEDAFRHCYWSALMARHMGRVAAEGFGDRHEDRPSLTAEGMARKEMDLHNNRMGRSIGEQAISVRDARLRCYEAAKSDVLQTQLSW